MLAGSYGAKGMKRCPLLFLNGVPDSEVADFLDGEHKIQWVVDICLECPLGKRCVFDSPGRVSKVDRKALEDYYQEKLHK